MSVVPNPQPRANWREFSVRPGKCPICGPTLYLKLANHELAVHCLRCHANPITLSLVAAIQRHIRSLPSQHVYALSASRPMRRWLNGHSAVLSLSEHFVDLPRGSFKGPVQCQDPQQLTFPKQHFDLCTATDVFEYVLDDARAFAEIHRVLKPGAGFIFTVRPLRDTDTLERIRIVDGRVLMLRAPSYRPDAAGGGEKSLYCRNYGTDICDRLRAAGFKDARMENPHPRRWWGFSREVIVARR